MEIRGLGKGWDEYKVGECWRTVGRTVTEADLNAFLRITGMDESTFTDHEFRRKHGAINRQFVPGALVYTFVEGICLRAFEGSGLVFLNMELDIKAPCFVGDTIHGEVEVTELRQTSKSDRGLMRTRITVKNQKGETLLVYTPLRMVKSKAEMDALAQNY
ncbi:MAG: MaoC family dehydratase N-terminal domain-containing protein [Alphaproteobacteria bacterium]